MDVFTCIILGILSLDTIRALIAMTGWVKPDAKLSWLIYGRRDKNTVISALKELGFNQEKSDYVVRNFRKLVRDLPRMTGITADNAALQLIVLLSKYTVKFPNEVRYGEEEGSTSNYYVDTMEISHDPEDIKKLRAIMTYLLATKVTLKKDVIISPKGGNPIFARGFADSIHGQLLVAKPMDDNSRITGDNVDTLEHFKINYEGSWKILNKHKKDRAYIIDCNTADGTQLLNILSEINRIKYKCGKSFPLDIQSQVFVLFCANAKGTNIDIKFESHKAELIRYFDLDEQAKQLLLELKNRCITEDREPDCVNEDDLRFANSIMKHLKDQKLWYYSDLHGETANESEEEKNGDSKV